MCVSQAVSLCGVSGRDTGASFGVLAKDPGIDGSGAAVCDASDRERGAAPPGVTLHANVIGCEL
jgi:hypothetical protein